VMIIRGGSGVGPIQAPVVHRRQAVSAGRSVDHDEQGVMRFVPTKLFNRAKPLHTFVGRLFGLRLA